MQVAAGVVAVGTMLWIILMWALLFVLRTAGAAAVRHVVFLILP